ncbi:beta-lactamase 2 [Fusarium mexicanum]|uniref:Beta-lactamase 2 n=1 Tax=Fusarium mexicanum TaxID=751941 RepID=A0A8H5I5F4_9HYPO|nr:beta-lactamase 2 [Fusarium mexicanum]
MLFSQYIPTLFSLLAGLHQVVDATPRYCPPYGPVLPAPRQASHHPAVQHAIDTITTVLKGQTAGFNASGVSVGVKSIYEDEPLLDFHYTPSIINTKKGVKKINASTVYRLGSITKVFTVVAALRLAQDGVLSMNDPVTRWIPELAHGKSPNSSDELDVTHWGDITIGDAAAHLSGLGGDMTTDIAAFPFEWEALGLPKLSKKNKIPACKGPPGELVCTRKDFLNIFKSYRPPVYQPSQSPVYSNAGISVVGLVVEAASKKTFDAAIKDLVLKPLGLKQTYSGIVQENSENMFIPAGSADWDANIGIFAPAGAMGSSTTDMLSFMTSILKNKALQPPNTRRWLKPNTFTSTWSASVGSPWEIYRVDNLTSDGRIIDLYTKGGTLSGYQSGMAMIPDTGLVVFVLGAGPEVSSVWAQLATLNIVEALIPAMEMAARDEAKARFGGQYVDKKTGSALILSVDEGPGLVLSNWSARGFDILPNLNRFQPGRYNDTTDSGIKSVRLYPTGIENKSRAAWRAVFLTLSDTEADMIEGLTKVNDVTCITWHMLDRFIYNGLSMDHFEFKYGKDGKAVSIKSKAFDVEMERVEKKA